MRTVLFSEQIQHGDGTAKEKLNELLDRTDQILISDYISKNDPDVNFTGRVTIQHVPVVTEEQFNQMSLAKYTDTLPTFTDTGALGIPHGSASLRPTCGSPGMIRCNTDSNSFEGYNGREWVQFVADTRPTNPSYSELFIVDSESYWEYDSWCLFGNNNDARQRITQLLTIDPIVTRNTHGMWIEATQFATVAVKDDRFIRVYNHHTNSLQFYITIK